MRHLAWKEVLFYNDYLVVVNAQEKLTLRDIEYDSHVNCTTMITCICKIEQNGSQCEFNDNTTITLPWI